MKKYLKNLLHKKNKAKNDFEKDLYLLLKNAFYGKTLENVRHPIRVDFSTKDDSEKIFEQQ